jgi:hypothetical protein
MSVVRLSARCHCDKIDCKLQPPNLKSKALNVDKAVEKEHTLIVEILASVVVQGSFLE